MKVSLIMSTARDNLNCIVGLEKTHLLTPTITSLNAQDFPHDDFELIIGDCLPSDRTIPLPFEKIHFPMRIVDCYRSSKILQAGYLDNITPKNLGAYYAKGELLMFIDDCCEFPPDWVRLVWEAYMRGQWASSLTHYHEGGKPKPIPTKMDKDYRGVDRGGGFKEASKFVKSKFIVDSRYHYLGGVEERGELPGNLFYGYSAVPKRAFHAVNGYDVKLTGNLACDDIDLGARLEKAFGPRVYLSRKIMHVEHWHHGVSPKIGGEHRAAEILKCNWGLSLLNLDSTLPVNVEKPSLMKMLQSKESICPKCHNLMRCRGEKLAAQFAHDSPQLQWWLNVLPTGRVADGSLFEQK